MAVIKRKSLVGKNVIKKPIATNFRPMIRSRHPSHDALRRELVRLPFRSVIRLGSTTELNDAATLAGNRIELNSIESIRNSSNKYKMKECFSKNAVKTARWFKFNGKLFQDRSLESKSEKFDISPNEMRFPIVAKSYFGSKGKGNTLLKSSIEILEFAKNHNLDNYIFEEYSNFNKEYRLHITKNGCFYSCRKMLKKEFKEHENSWQRHDDNCVWIVEENPDFDKPVNWDEIVEHCVKALNSCGLDFGACDLRVQNNRNSDGDLRKECDFIVVEINSAPSFGKVTLEKYKEELPKLLIEKKDGKK